MYLVKTPNFIQSLFPNFVWRIDSNDPTLYLTFDDGPIPEVTPWVLDTLEKYQAKATFFCVGDNIQRNPDLFDEVIQRGHSVGNHTFHHMSGWRSDNIEYYHNVRNCAHLVKSDLFRPPYGKLKPHQIQFLQRHYRIIMWDVLSADFDRNTTPEKCADNVIQNAAPGSIIVFHDSLKAEPNLRHALPAVLDHFTELGYSFNPISQSKIQRTKRRIA